MVDLLTVLSGRAVPPSNASADPSSRAGAAASSRRGGDEANEEPADSTRASSRGSASRRESSHSESSRGSERGQRSGRSTGRRSDSSRSSELGDELERRGAPPVGWSLLEMAGVPPPARSNHTMLSHGPERLIIFGGFDGTGFLGDLCAAVLDA